MDENLNNKGNAGKGTYMVFGIAIGTVGTAIILIFAVIIRTIMGGSVLNNNNVIQVNSEDVEQKVGVILEVIDKYYYNDDDYRSVLAENIYQSVLDSLDDPYADYYTAEEWLDVNAANEGIYCGIGVAVSLDEETGEIVATNPYEHAPGYKAGMRAGDRIIAVDDQEVAGMILDDAVSLIRGEEGTTVKVTVRRGAEYIDFVITREKIESITVETEVLDNNIGYLRIISFDGVTYQQFIDGLNELLAQNIEGIIFDVRTNGGGYYYTVVNMLDRILPEGKIVYTEDKNGNQEVEYSDEECLDMPMCVLVNGYTASASEIFAGAIQDYELGPIIGEQTYGKGIVQNTYTLSDGSAVKFTVSGYFTPNGRSIHEVGITPDMVVSLPDDLEAYDETGVIKEGYDTQLNTAIEYITGEMAE